jgi:hypothetical protein
MTQKITYLFGAGASAGNQELLDDFKYGHTPKKEPEGIPVVSIFNKDIDRFFGVLSYYQTSGAHDLKGNKSDLARRFHQNFIELYNEFKNIYSFDTYAKKLFESGEKDKLQELKVLLKSYLIYRQSIAHRDKRYDLFFATLMEKGHLNPNISILSWNYDTQVEMSVGSFAPKAVAHPKHLHFLSNPPFFSDNDSLPPFIKLNGSISYEASSNSVFTNTDPQLLDNTQAISRVLEYYESHLKNSNNNAIEFSWEESEHKKNIGGRLYEIIEKTDILVIIGYSFPTLNRKKDADIIKRLKDSARVYIQCKEKHFDNIKTRIETLRPMPIINDGEKIFPIKMIDEFFIPHELG